MEVYSMIAAVLLVTFTGQCQASYSGNMLQVLMMADKNVVPAEANGGPVEVAIGFNIFDIQKQKQDENEVAIHLLIVQQWTDTRLRFCDNNNNKPLHVPSADIWTPDMVFYYRINPESDSKFLKATVSPEGTVTYVSRYFVKVPCERWTGPNGFTCRLKVGSWIYPNDFVTLSLISDEADASYLSRTSTLDVESSSVVREATKYDCCPETYETVELTLNLRRKN